MEQLELFKPEEILEGRVEPLCRFANHGSKKVHWSGSPMQESRWQQQKAKEVEAYIARAYSAAPESMTV